MATIKALFFSRDGQGPKLTFVSRITSERDEKQADEINGKFVAGAAFVICEAEYDENVNAYPDLDDLVFKHPYWPGDFVYKGNYTFA